ncbi:FxsA family protein [Mangrovimicrobium sediminis]|uniref:FxsA family protein n=2 Tax=Mangrovimicrobium sediminis TaxID=2562682 RepID=A0A4Z0M3V7_9GAMM|nr:FxsA family protein [Haliea sp. SAOS-164]
MLLPWLELFTLIQLGIKTSALTALLYVLATVVLGVFILRRQGAQMLERVRDIQMGRAAGAQLLVDDLSMGLAGLLFIIPGMITDVVALIVLIGPLRRSLARLLGVKASVSETGGSMGASTVYEERGHVTIEGQYSRVDEGEKP